MAGQIRNLINMKEYVCTYKYRLNLETINAHIYWEGS